MACFGHQDKWEGDLQKEGDMTFLMFPTELFASVYFVLFRPECIMDGKERNLSPGMNGYSFINRNCRLQYSSGGKLTGNFRLQIRLENGLA
ncbi:hypothetical protein CEXT_440081 [Caerostris extrusa]|uniref:Uncharacterized protein n=1 Tax=Caerostris extrusa TaxID=172846 RepID=A0AAV4XK36_CAEEX|nr:hypothetical protein CEXT_440081 [Caerostris extrusa]